MSKPWTKRQSGAALQLLSLRMSRLIASRNLEGVPGRGLLPGLMFDYVLRDSCGPELIQVMFDAFEEVREKIAEVADDQG